MNRRAFLYGTITAALALPLAAEAQPTARVARVGFLDDFTAGGFPTDVLHAFQGALQARGWTDGKTLTLRFATLRTLSKDKASRLKSPA